MDWMLEAFRRTRKDGAVGVDGRTGREYAANLAENWTFAESCQVQVLLDPLTIPAV
jgi:hypothetical protein